MGERMDDANWVFESLGINRNDSVAFVINKVSRDMMDSRDPLCYANGIITRLGGDVQNDVADARIIMKTMIKEAMNNPDSFDSNSAMEKSFQNVNDLKAKMPYLFTKPEEISEVEDDDSEIDESNITMEEIFAKALSEPQPDPVPEKIKHGQKGAMAKQIYMENKEHGVNYVLEKIMEELQVNKACARTYVYNAANACGDKISFGKRGRPAKNKE